jgi:hypothetical protein
MYSPLVARGFWGPSPKNQTWDALEHLSGRGPWRRQSLSHDVIMVCDFDLNCATTVASNGRPHMLV